MMAITSVDEAIIYTKNPIGPSLSCVMPSQSSRSDSGRNAAKDHRAHRTQRLKGLIADLRVAYYHINDIVVNHERSIHNTRREA
jgi:hypothetical protein